MKKTPRREERQRKASDEKAGIRRNFLIASADRCAASGLRGSMNYRSRINSALAAGDHTSSTS